MEIWNQKADIIINTGFDKKLIELWFNQYNIWDIVDISLDNFDEMSDFCMDIDDFTILTKKFYLKTFRDFMNIELEIDWDWIYVSDMYKYSDEELDMINWIVNQTLNLNKELWLKN